MYVYVAARRNINETENPCAVRYVFRTITHAASDHEEVNAMFSRTV